MNFLTGCNIAAESCGNIADKNRITRAAFSRAMDDISPYEPVPEFISRNVVEFAGSAKIRIVDFKTSGL